MSDHYSLEVCTRKPELFVCPSNSNPKILCIIQKISLQENQQSTAAHLMFNDVHNTLQYSQWAKFLGIMAHGVMC
ncbi:hypothetical protein FRX31_033821 [Thalictrum thalictroides]|uniref:Uncharacterized protein n=1 Tax=Thalictrum thalictroides TaxID=46969 RepID=A0A7J6UVL7_THATH|nr:hypothetical protein FRX31_033821 [Thalictrum thalictroides]